MFKKLIIIALAIIFVPKIIEADKQKKALQAQKKAEREQQKAELLRQYQDQLNSQKSNASNFDSNNKKQKK